MSDVRVVSLNGLQKRLEKVLASEPALVARFEAAFATQNEDLVQEAMDALAGCPEDVRGKAHDEMLAWLFDGNDNSGLADLPTAGRGAH